jgi:hypothetical protein
MSPPGKRSGPEVTPQGRSVEKATPATTDTATVVDLADRRRRRPAAPPINARSPYGLSAAELAAEVRRCWAAGWRTWELFAGFGGRVGGILRRRAGGGAS